MKKTGLGASLSQFVMNSENSFNNPYDEDTMNGPITIDYVKEREKERKHERSEKKIDPVQKILSKGDTLLDKYLSEDEAADDFDMFIGNFLLDDEDTNFRQSLTSKGRKYARENRLSGASSEISKAYAGQEKALLKLQELIEKDTELVEKDIQMLRMSRTRNFKSLSDLIQSKAQMHNTLLSTIKEQNSMTKNQFDLQAKAEKTKKEDNSEDSTASRAVQQLFGMGRDSILGSLGGYSGVSGATESYSSDDDPNFDEDEYIQQKYFSNSNMNTETDGDKFLKYEGMGVHYILLYDDNNNFEIISEDRDGNVIPDYPIPSDPKNLEFSISESTGTATDNLANQYELRKM